MKKVVVFLVFAFLFAYTVSATTEFIQFTTNATETDSAKSGAIVKIMPETNVLLRGIYKMPNDKSTRCMISSTGSDILASSTTFVLDECRINYGLLAGNTYYLLFDNSSSNRVRERADATNTPFRSGLFNWTAGYEGTSTSNTRSIYGVNYTNTTNLLSPVDSYSSIINNITFNASSYAQYGNLANATFFLWSSSGSIYYNQTLTSSSTYNTANWTVRNISMGNYLWNTLWCDTSSNCAFAPSNRSLSIGYEVNSESYLSSVGDLSIANFTIDLNLSSSIVSSRALLSYNGTTYSSVKTTSGTSTLFTANVSIPGVSSIETKNFYWVFYFTESGSLNIFNTTSRQQTVSPSNFSQCGVGERAVNYTIYNEDTGNLVTSDFDALFTWRLDPSSTLSKNISLALSGANNYQFCINVNQTFYTDASITLSSTGYSTRTYSFNDAPYSNQTTHQKLYLLNSSDSTDVILVLKNSGLLPLEGYTIKVYRKDSGLLVENDVTDVFGQITTTLVENDVKYRLEFYDTSNVLVKTINEAVVACRNVVCVQQFIVEDTTDPFDPFNDIEGYTSDLTFDNSTNTFSFTWVDNTGVSSSHRLEVTKYTFSNVSIVCNSTSSASSGILTCAVGNSRASYSATGYRTASPQNRRELNSVKVGSAYGTFGLEGLFWSMSLLMTMLLIGVYYPPAGVGLYLFGVVMLGIFDIVYIHPGIMIAQIVIGGMFIWLFRS